MLNIVVVVILLNYLGIVFGQAPYVIIRNASMTVDQYQTGFLVCSASDIDVIEWRWLQVIGKNLNKTIPDSNSFRHFFTYYKPGYKEKFICQAKSLSQKDYYNSTDQVEITVSSNFPEVYVHNDSTVSVKTNEPAFLLCVTSPELKPIKWEWGNVDERGYSYKALPSTNSNRYNITKDVINSRYVCKVSTAGKSQQSSNWITVTVHGAANALANNYITIALSLAWVIVHYSNIL